MPPADSTHLFLVAVDAGQVVEILGPYLRDDVISSNRGISHLRNGYPSGDVYCARTGDLDRARALVETLLSRHKG